MQTKLEESAVLVEEYANQMEQLANDRAEKLKDAVPIHGLFLIIPLSRASPLLIRLVCVNFCYLVSIVMDLTFSGLFSLNAANAFRSMACMVMRSRPLALCLSRQSCSFKREFTLSMALL